MSLLDDAFALISVKTRAISYIIPDAVFDESGRDELVITQHPVERGAAVADHAFKLPAKLEMRCGFSNSSAGVEGYVDEAYRALLDLQEQREPFEVATGKRLYGDMLIRSLTVHTDDTSEHALMVSVGLEQVIIVDTSTTGGSALQGEMANPASTAPEANLGTKQLAQAQYAPGGA